jgi:RNA polymerase sigma factor (sigma-70 family)
MSPHAFRSAAPDAPQAAPSAGVWREWYERHGAPVYNYLRFHLPSADLAEDLTGEVFLRAFRAEATYDATRGEVRTWLIGIARNALRDHLRQTRRRRLVPLGSLRDLVSSAPSPEERFLQEEEAARLLAAVAELSPADRELIGLRYGSGLAAAEIATIVGARESAVRTRLWRALGRLRAELAP